MRVGARTPWKPRSGAARASGRLRAIKPLRKRIALFALPVLGLLVGLWIAGPAPLETDGYVQSVTATAAVVCKVDASARQLSLRVEPSGAAAAAPPAPVVEAAATALHALRVEGLRPGNVYRYALREGDRVVARGEFRTAPADDRKTVRFVAVGDSGNMPWWFNMHRIGWSRLRPLLTYTHRTQQWAVARWIAAERPDFFLHLGDIVYWPDVWDAHGEAFFRPFAPVLQRTALFTLAGNHDLRSSPAPFDRIFHNPIDATAARSSRDYTFAWGALRVVALDVLDESWQQGPRRAWLEKTLAEASEPWLVVACHVPCFSVYRDEQAPLRDTLWPLLRAHAVDLVLSGDDHHYARFRRPQPDDPVQCIAGGGGKSLYTFRADDPRLAASARTYGFVSVEVRGTVLRVLALGAGGAELDRFEIDRSRGDLPASIHAGRRARILALRKGE